MIILVFEYQLRRNVLNFHLAMSFQFCMDLLLPLPSPRCISFMHEAFICLRYFRLRVYWLSSRHFDRETTFTSLVHDNAIAIRYRLLFTEVILKFWLEQAGNGVTLVIDYYELWLAFDLHNFPIFELLIHFSFLVIKLNIFWRYLLSIK